MNDWLYDDAYKGVFPAWCMADDYGGDVCACETILAVTRESGWAYALRAMGETYGERTSPEELRKALFTIKGGELATILGTGYRRASMLDKARGAHLLLFDAVDRAQITKREAGVGFLELLEAAVEHERTIVFTIGKRGRVRDLGDLLDALCPEGKNGREPAATEYVEEALRLFKQNMRTIGDNETRITGGGADADSGRVQNAEQGECAGTEGGQRHRAPAE